MLPFALSEWIKFSIFALVRPKNQLQMSKHLTVEQRYAISAMLQIPMSQKAIASAIGVDKSTISRELKRNCDNRSDKYVMDLAQRKADRRQQSKRRRQDFCEPLKELAKVLIEEGFSPEQVAGRCKLDNQTMVSHETIYRWIWDDKRKGGELHKHLRRQGRKYRHRGSAKDSRGKILNRVDISQREAEVEKKERVGDLEIDTIIGKNHKGAAVTINDRATGYVWIRKLTGKEAAPLAEKTIDALMPYKQHLKTITSDNGKEFTKHELIACELGINFYFCKPYHSWERGANENTNGLIRQYIPKGTDFSELTDEYVAWVENKINNRPRKRLGYLTPTEKLDQLLNMNSVAFIS